MREMLEEKLSRFEELEKQLVDPEVLADSARLSTIAREHGSLAKLVTKYRRFKQLNTQIVDAMEMIEGPDPEMREQDIAFHSWMMEGRPLLRASQTTEEARFPSSRRVRLRCVCHASRRQVPAPLFA